MNAIFDTNGLYAQSWYAATADDPHNPVEKAIEICVRSVVQYLLGYRLSTTPSKALYCWDGRAKRDKGRAEKPNDYYLGMAPVQQILQEITGVPSYISESEADDAVASAATACIERHESVIVFSNDKDVMQIISDRVQFFDIRQKQLVTAEQACLRHGVLKPEQIAIALAIKGDSGDSIKGIPKWGPKKVSKIFQEIQPDSSLEEIIEHVCLAAGDKADCFIESLELTLLNRCMPTPEPVAIQLQDSPVLDCFPSIRGLILRSTGEVEL